MIAVFSIFSTEESTIHVSEWIDHLHGDYIRINAEDLPRMSFAMAPADSDAYCFVTHDGRTIPLSQIRSVWFRRGAKPPLPDLDEVPDPTLRETMAHHMDCEMKGAAKVLYHALDHAHWVSHPKNVVPNKFQVLQRARAHGIHIPPTLITNHKQTLLDFHREHGEIIIKCITDPEIFQKDNQVFSSFTNVFEKEHIDSLPDRFFPVLVQKKIEKAWEIRTFYLDGECHSMAIFSQTNDQTRVDFRRYDFQNPNRTVPYRMEGELEAKLVDLMNELDLNTGSLDLIRSVDGHTYFLEVNPAGQFGMVSFPCNMNLEKKLAQYLISKDVT